MKFIFKKRLNWEPNKINAENKCTNWKNPGKLKYNMIKPLEIKKINVPKIKNTSLGTFWKELCLPDIDKHK